MHLMQIKGCAAAKGLRDKAKDSLGCFGGRPRQQGTHHPQHRRAHSHPSPREIRIGKHKLHPAAPSSACPPSVFPVPAPQMHTRTLHCCQQTGSAFPLPSGKALQVRDSHTIKASVNYRTKLYTTTHVKHSIFIKGKWEIRVQIATKKPEVSTLLLAREE